MIFFTSDTHFLHANILKYCPNRKFDTVEEHDAHLIQVWNARIAPNDTVFHIGDFAFGAVEKSYPILDALNGKKILVTGNHDVRHLKHNEFRGKFAAVKFAYHEVEVNFRGHTVLVVLCHYPLESFNKMRYGSYHFFGHTHQTNVRHNHPYKFNVGVDSREDHAPWGKDEIMSLVDTPFPTP